MGSNIPKNRTGQRFGRLIALKICGHRGMKLIWECLCDCGKTAYVASGNLASGHTTSCGCFKIQRTGDSHSLVGKAHGHCKNNNCTPTYKSWASMKGRCSNPRVSNYYNYGGRGIVVCERWRTSFNSFLEDMGERPPGTSLDRIDSNGNYEPGNCRWATDEIQRSNRRKKYLKIRKLWRQGVSNDD